MVSHYSPGLFAALLLTLTSINASNILFLLPLSSPSHHNFLQPLLQRLSKHHQVTLLTSSSTFTLENVNIVRLKTDYSQLVQFMNSAAFGSLRGKPLDILMELEKRAGPTICEGLFQLKYFQEQISAGFKYDVALATSTNDGCSLPFAKLLSKNFIYVNFMRHLTPPYATGVDLVPSFALYPNVISHVTVPMGFFERLSNFIMSCYWIGLRMLMGYDGLMQKHTPDVTSVKDTFRNVSLVFSNSDSVLSEPIPSAGFVIKVGGMHLRKPKAVPKELEMLLDKSNGFILFSMGTVAELSSAGRTVISAFIEAFGKLKETVIWKTSENITNLPSNVKLIKWLPQQDVLGHPKIRLFISQGGIFGLQEGIYNGVPILGNPFFMEQYSNIRRIEELGIGKKIHLSSNFSSDEIYEAMREVIDNQWYRENAKKYSRILQDEIRNSPPLDKAIYWIEYLTRHSDHNTHFRYSVSHLNFFEYYMIDVIALLLLAPRLVWKTLKLLWKLIFCKNVKCRQTD